MKYWIHSPYNDNHIAYQMFDCYGGYIPYAPHGGRHIMDDFGNLQEALPQRYFLDATNPWHWDCFKDQTYRGH